MSRFAKTFERLAANNEKAFVAYLMAGDPDVERARGLITMLPSAGVDILEIGVPFTDPMADGPTIQLAAQRALEAGATLRDSLETAKAARAENPDTPIVLMGYYNPIYNMGVENFLDAANDAGVDGLIVVDLPAEEDDELNVPARKKGIDLIRLMTPTTDDKRLPRVLENTGGFIYYVSITGITGAAEANAEQVAPEVARIKSQTELPVCVGFGVKSPETARAIAGIADGVVVGSAIVGMLANGKSDEEILEFVKTLADATHSPG